MATQNLRDIRAFPDLVRYLEEELDWPLQGYSLEDAAFTYEPEELGLKQEDAAHVKTIYQLRPLAHGQPWGIFFVEFENKKLPVVVLRRILSHLVIKKRASANKASAPAWHAEDLLFVTAYGEENTDAREMAFAHFHQTAGDLPTLHVLGWDGGDTPLKLANVDRVLHELLKWPQDESDANAWRETWSKPFKHKLGHTIRTADLLAEELARLARGIRDKASRMLAAETEKGALTKLYKAFQTALIHDLTPQTFADTYAQTITYGLLTAAISRTEMSEGRYGTALVADNIVDMVPITNPFLKEMLQTFLKVGGRKGGIDFDELGIQDVVELLRGDETDLPAVLADFGNKTRGEDPVIHFYEHFLSAYNKQLKIQRGVFYTPQPVVSYIVRSVHELLQTEFGLTDGLADTTTWGEMLKKHPDLKLPPLTDEPGEKRTISSDEPFVQILDPATGTATFLVEVIDVIHRTLAAKWKQQRLTDAQQLAAWNDYVPNHLLPRLHAFELMMAPYAIAHMKIGLKLAETGYRFGTEERARIYLTNALEPWVKQLPLIGFDALAHEAAAVNEIKRHKRFTVVIGNPPYARDSKNRSAFIEQLMDRYKAAVRNERNLQPLGDDCIKFICLGHAFVDKSGAGILSYISNNKYVSGSTIHRGIREELAKTFGAIQITNLHGDVGHPTDRNVFEIREGVTISTFAKVPASEGAKRIQYRELFGAAEMKCAALLLPKTLPGWSDFPVAPQQFFFIPTCSENMSDLDSAISVAEMFGDGSADDKGTRWGNGVKTNRDDLLIADTRLELTERFTAFEDATLTNAKLAERFALTDGPYWETARERQKVLTSEWRRKVFPYCYRPFSNRWILYLTNLMEIGRGGASKHVMKHMMLANLGLITHRTASKQLDYTHFFAVNTLIDVRTFPDREGVPYLFPLYVYPNDSSQPALAGIHEERRPNLSPRFLKTIASRLGLRQEGSHGLPAGLTPEDIFHYAYAVFHSPGYRSRYAEFLKIDFPRLPLTGNLELFRALARLGGELTALHLLESPKVNNFITRYEGQGDNSLPKKPIYKDGAVWINASQRFEGVPEEVWNFHIGGYQVCEKWLKDRKGRVLSADDIAHYQRVVVALHETIRLMAEIDAVIEQHGGWPGAFQGGRQGAELL